jgi:hypothetical protein
MNELVPLVAQYGLPGLVVAGVLGLAWRLIDRGFEFRVPPKRRR